MQVPSVSATAAEKPQANLAAVPGISSLDRQFPRAQALRWRGFLSVAAAEAAGFRWAFAAFAISRLAEHVPNIHYLARRLPRLGSLHSGLIVIGITVDSHAAYVKRVAIVRKWSETKGIAKRLAVRADSRNLARNWLTKIL
jgi:hypothetical protein